MFNALPNSTMLTTRAGRPSVVHHQVGARQGLSSSSSANAPLVA